MVRTAPSAVVTDMGRRIQLRLEGRFYEISQDELHTLLDVSAGPAGLGITIDRDRLRFEFAADDQSVEMSAAQLHRRLNKQTASKKSSGPNLKRPLTPARCISARR